MSNLLLLVVAAVSVAAVPADAVELDAYIYRADLDAYVQLDPNLELEICGDDRYTNQVLLEVTVPDDSRSYGPIKYKGAVSRSISRTTSPGTTVYPVRIDLGFGLEAEMTVDGLPQTTRWAMRCTRE